MSAADRDCIACARECARLAAITSDPDVRDALLNMARAWMAMAMHEPKLPEPEYHPAWMRASGVRLPVLGH